MKSITYETDVPNQSAKGIIFTEHVSTIDTFGNALAPQFTDRYYTQVHMDNGDRILFNLPLDHVFQAINSGFNIIDKEKEKHGET